MLDYLPGHAEADSMKAFVMEPSPAYSSHFQSFSSQTIHFSQDFGITTCFEVF
jgi:hypothetical protein